MTTPARPLLILASLALLLLAIAATPADGQISDAECRAAQVWHLQQAMHWSAAGPAQTFHLGAATAAEKLASLGGSPCTGWRTDARQPYGDANGVIRSDA